MEILRSENLAIGYSKKLIDEISLNVKPGEIVTLIGPNGSGKSTLLKTLTGQLSSKGGVIFIGDKNMEDLSVKDMAKKMSMVMTERIRPELMTCREIVEAGRYPYTGYMGILSEADKKAVNDAMNLTNTLELADTDFMTLSDGQRQRVLLAKAICQEPEILILDEPTSYLDIRYKVEILKQIKDFAKQSQVAVIMSLHELEIAMRISDTVVALGEGQVLGIGTPEEIFKEAFIRKLYGIEGQDISQLGSKPWFSEERSENKSLNDLGVDKTSESEKNNSKKNNSEKNNSSKEDFENNVSENKKTSKTGDGKSPKVIMVQGTMSNAGKTLIAAGLCRIFANDGYRVVPFKSQNMALNSYVTETGEEMGRAQVMQAECCRVMPQVWMNPILLKPTSKSGSQVIVRGRSIGNMSAREYFGRKKDFLPDIKEAFNHLAETADIIVVEGAGSPVEMNLKKDDIVNMGVAELLDASVILVGDIDRGGIFPQIIGTLDLLEPSERDRVKGVVVNKFRGDKTLFDDGVKILEEKGKTPVLGVVPFMDLDIDDEDSLAETLLQSSKIEDAKLDIAVIRLPYISNFTDIYPFKEVPSVSVRFVTSSHELGNPDLILIPGSKNTIHDLRWIKEEGLDKMLLQQKENGTPILGICGGFQILGKSIKDEEAVESGGEEEGLGLLPVETALGTEKKQVLFNGSVVASEGLLAEMNNCPVEGYEIHMGETVVSGDAKEFTSNGTGYYKENVFGTYIHGFFDTKEVLSKYIDILAKRKGVSIDTSSIVGYREYKDSQYELLAKGLREALDMDKIYEILG